MSKKRRSALLTAALLTSFFLFNTAFASTASAEPDELEVGDSEVTSVLAGGAKGPYGYFVSAGIRNDNWKSTPNVSPGKNVRVCLQAGGSSSAGASVNPKWFFSIRKASDKKRIWASKNYKSTPDFKSYCSPWVDATTKVYARVTVHPVWIHEVGHVYFKVWLYYN